MRAQAAWLLVIGVLVGTATVQALTAFGKSTNTDKDKTPTPKVPKGRLCTSNADCAGTASTTCLLDKTTGKKHCLCRDNLPPINSKCAVIPTAPGKTCAETSECVINAECIVTNNETRRKACACKEGYSYDASIDDSMCNGCGAVWPCVVTILVTLMVLLGSETLAGTAAT